MSFPRWAIGRTPAGVLKIIPRDIRVKNPGQILGKIPEEILKEFYEKLER